MKFYCAHFNAFVSIFFFSFIACSNSEGIDGIEKLSSDGGDKKNCFDSYRLPKINAESCVEKFFSYDTLMVFPESGFFQRAFVIRLSDENTMNCEIGGKTPSPQSPRFSVLQIDSSMTIHCIDYSEKAEPRGELVRTYILEEPPTIPAIFITVEPNSLFDSDSGIFMDGPNAEEKIPHYGANYWLDKEVPIFVELVESDTGILGFAQKAGLKVFGNYSRAKPKKSVAITFREKYGENRLRYKLFPDFPNLNVFKSFILRNFGTNFGNDYVRDRLASSISDGLDVEYQRGRFVVVYYNSEYFGIYDMRERSNEFYFETHYGINHNNINLVKADNSTSAGSAKDYISLMDWIQIHNLDADSNYAHVDSLIDIENFINYMHVELYANNRDWPANNLKKWNSIVPKTRWKWFLYDLDNSMGYRYSPSNNNVFEFATAENGNPWPNGPEHTLLLRRLLENKNFKMSFVNRMLVLLQKNFEKRNVLGIIEKMMQEVKSEIPRDQDRWSLDSSWMNEELNIIKRFAENRPVVITNELREHFELGEIYPISFSVSGQGNILIHGLPLDDFPATIDFLGGNPVTITAMPELGGVWVKWSDGFLDSVRTIWPDRSTSYTAIFE